MDGTLFLAIAGTVGLVIGYFCGRWPYDAAKEKGQDTLGLVNPIELDPEPVEQLRPGDVLALFTDGLTEAMDPAGEQFGTDRLRAVVSDVVARPAAAIVDRVFTAVDAHLAGGNPLDDMTLVVAKVGE